MVQSFTKTDHIHWVHTVLVLTTTRSTCML